MVELILGVCSLLTVLIIPFLIRLLLRRSIKRCTSTLSMKGKVIIVTGANSGLGYHTAKDLASRGGRVILACRNEAKATSARDNIIAETGNKDVIYKQLNLSSLKSVRSFVEDIKNTEARLDVLVNNAGVYISSERYTEDDIIEGMQINTYAPHLLSILLLPMLKKSQGRIVNVSSLCHFRGEVKFDKINKAGSYDGDSIYSNSKLCCVILTKELARRLAGTGVTVNCLHPGVILTNIIPEDNSPSLTFWVFRIWCWFCCRTAEEGAQTIIYLSVADEVKNVTGKYFVDCRESFVLWTANNETLAKQLWDYSAKLLGLKDVVL